MIEFSECPINGLKVVKATISWHVHTTNVLPAVSGEAAYLVNDKPAGLVETSGFVSSEVESLARQLIEAMEQELLEHLGASEEIKEEEVQEKIKGLVREF